MRELFHGAGKWPRLKDALKIAVGKVRILAGRCLLCVSNAVFSRGGVADGVNLPFPNVDIKSFRFGMVSFVVFRILGGFI